MVYFRGRRATHFGNLSTLMKVHGFKRFHISPWILVMKIIVVTLLFLVATESVTIQKDRPVINTDFVIALDASPSMASNDFQPDRITVAKKIAVDWLRIIPNSTRVGLVVFSQEIIDEKPLTFNENAIINAIDNVKIDYSLSGTSIDYAIRKSIELFKSSPGDKSRDKIVLLLTDGTEDVDNSTIADAVLNKIKIFSFGIGNENFSNNVSLDDVPEEFRDLYNKLTFNFSKLEDISSRTDGKAYKVFDAESFRKAFEDVTLDRIKIKLNSNYYVVLLIAILSILELVIYSMVGAL